MTLELELTKEINLSISMTITSPFYRGPHARRTCVAINDVVFNIPETAERKNDSVTSKSCGEYQ